MRLKRCLFALVIVIMSITCILFTGCQSGIRSRYEKVTTKYKKWCNRF